MNYSRTKDAIVAACAGLDGLAILDDKLAENLPDWEKGISLHKNGIVIRSSFDLQVGELITRANAKGWLFDLITALVNAFPENDALHDVLQSEFGTIVSDGPQTGGLEALLGGVTLDFGALERCKSAACRIDMLGRPKPPLGTGFLIAENLVLTNWHVIYGVIQQPSLSEKLRFRFGLGESAAAQIDYRASPGENGVCVLQASAAGGIEIGQGVGEPEPDELDFAIVRVVPEDSQRVVADQIDLNFVSANIQKGGALMAVQYPLGGTLQFALGVNQGLNDVQSRMKHTIPTNHGSSGSLIVDSNLNPIALHNGTSVATRSKTECNTAIPLKTILESLNPELLESVLN